MVNRRKLNPDESVRQLMGAALRTLRDEQKWSVEALAEKLYMAPDVLYRIERGEQAMHPDLAETLDELFVIERPKIFGFAKLAPLAAREAAPQRVQALASAESASDSLRVYDPIAIPGLAQIPAYTIALVQGGPFPQEADAISAMRQTRQRVLTREPTPPRIYMCVNEATLRLTIGSPHIMREQIEHIEELAKHPRVSFQIIRTGTRSRAGLVSPFTLITFPRQSPAVHVDGSIGLVRDPDTVARWSETFEAIRTSAESADTSARLLREIKESLS